MLFTPSGRAARLAGCAIAPASRYLALYSQYPWYFFIFNLQADIYSHPPRGCVCRRQAQGKGGSNFTSARRARSKVRGGWAGALAVGKCEGTRPLGRAIKPTRTPSKLALEPIIKKVAAWQSHSLFFISSPVRINKFHLPRGWIYILFSFFLLDGHLIIHPPRGAKGRSPSGRIFCFLEYLFYLHFSFFYMG